MCIDALRDGGDGLPTGGLPLLDVKVEKGRMMRPFPGTPYLDGFSKQLARPALGAEPPGLFPRYRVPRASF
jgi:hypothetical protein